MVFNVEQQIHVRSDLLTNVDNMYMSGLPSPCNKMYDYLSNRPPRTGLGLSTLFKCILMLLKTCNEYKL